MPDGVKLDINPADFMAGLLECAPFMGDDASRPWSCGVLLTREGMFATNNLSLVHYTKAFPAVSEKGIVIPAQAVKEILGIGKLPKWLQVSGHSLSLFYDAEMWLRTQLVDVPWPSVNSLLDEAHKGAELLTANDEVFNAITDILPFTDDMGRVYFNDGFVATTIEESEGARVELGEWFSEVQGVYIGKVFLLMQPIMTTIDLTHWPKPCPFAGNNLRGVIIGPKR